ncbi:hypothetical protein DPMN_126336 [Dreissena polymorpha]|uniref:Uncharacterized protein n=1 Tax=Dreissena polymorpha TaxID=45954 RepID=A0A9D4GVX1_DREPO|nr:hypothetical protein DPMN_126336 [Dreissena polymorpha]
MSHLEKSQCESINVDKDKDGVLPNLNKKTRSIPPLHITEEGVKKLLADLNISKARGPDSIPTIPQPCNISSRNHWTKGRYQVTGGMQTSPLSSRKEMFTWQRIIDLYL